MSAASRPTRVLAVASAGGHWIQLARVLPAFEDLDLVLVTTGRAPDPAIPRCGEYVVIDANRWSKLRMLRLAGQMLAIIVRERPDVVFSTGAAPGLFAIVFGRILGARTIWLDSIANVNELSLSGRIVRRFAGLWLTQWPELAPESGAEYAGAVL